MTLEDLLVRRSGRGTERGPDDIWAGAQGQRRRGHRVLVAAAMVVFVTAVGGGAWAIARNGTELPTTTATTLPTTQVPAEVPTVDITESGGEACNSDGFCVRISGTTPELQIYLTWQGEGIYMYATHECTLYIYEDVSWIMPVEGRMTGTLRADTPPVSLPHNPMSQLQIRYQGTVLQFFSSVASPDLGADLSAVLSPASALPPPPGCPGINGRDTP